MTSGLAQPSACQPRRSPGSLTDLKVYRLGGSSWLQGVPLYTSDFSFWLPFTYPPVSAVLFGVLPFVAAAALLAVAGLVSRPRTGVDVVATHHG